MVGGMCAVTLWDFSNFDTYYNYSVIKRVSGVKWSDVGS